jgi:hypothetical protein
VSFDGATTTVLVQVSPVVTTPPTTVVTPTAARPALHHTSRALAYTGSDDSGALGWALGLLAAGAVITALRINRRRRSTRVGTTEDIDL